MSRRAALLLSPLLIGSPGCDEKTSVESPTAAKSPAEPIAPAKAAEPVPPTKTVEPASETTEAVEEPPVETPALRGVEVEHFCKLEWDRIQVSAAIEIEQIDFTDDNATGTFRKFFDINCVQCVGELPLHEECEEYSWQCENTRLDLSELDYGEPMRGTAFSSSWHVRPIEDANELAEEIDGTLERIDDPTRHVGMKAEERDRVRDLAQRIKALLPGLTGSTTGRSARDSERSSVFLELKGWNRGILSVQDGTIRLMLHTPLGLGIAPCEGVHRPGDAVLGKKPIQPTYRQKRR
jgi:hypothetical protein